MEIAEHALSLAMACGRADGTLAPAELEAMSHALEEHFPLAREDSRRLARRRAELGSELTSVEDAGRALREALSPRERQLLLERILSAMVADGEAAVREVELFRSIGSSLDVAAPFVDGLLRSWIGTERGRWLSTLELPPDATVDRTGIVRSLRRMEDLYAEERFRLLAPELREMASRRLDLARKAATALLGELAEPTEAPLAETVRASQGAGPAPAPTSTVRRDNPDLDGIFG
jgi:uncharacterized tellurite resistance protein B-like protein